MSRYRKTQRVSLPVAGQEDALEALYASLPKIECRRLCADSCGPISLTPLEKKRMESAAGRELYTDAGNMACSLLVGSACSAYHVRPLICRLWGLVRRMQCPFGCIPERYLTDDEAYSLFRRIEQIAGGPLIPTKIREVVMGVMANPHSLNRKDLT